MTQPKIGVLLINTGTPEAPTTASVRSYLREFLSDPRVIDIPWLFRQLLLYVFILPFRSPRSAEAYRSVWGPEGAPLRVLSLQLQDKLNERLADTHVVRLAMRYGKPSIQEGYQALMQAGVERIQVLPLFPQYASAASGSAVSEVMAICRNEVNIPDLSFIGAFYHEPLFIQAQADLVRHHLDDFEADYLLFSYHGLPERQIQKSERGRICEAQVICPKPVGDKHYCYRAQAFETSRLILKALGTQPCPSSSSFQSRLGRTPWIKPYTDEVLPQLYAQGYRKLAIACPSFVTDCLETLEEIGMQAREQWLELGGTDFKFIPCLNDHPVWLDCLVSLLQRDQAP